jgi:hypothetical protein
MGGKLTMPLSKIGQALTEDEVFRGVIIPAGTSFSDTVVQRFEIMHKRPCDKYDDIHEWQHNYVWPRRRPYERIVYGKTIYGRCSKCPAMKSNHC